MVGPNTMLAATPWIKRNMLNVDPEQEKKVPTEAEMRVKRCAEKLQVPDWYRNYFKPETKFLKDKTPFECRPPNWKLMTGKKSRTPKKEPPKQTQPANDQMNTCAKTTTQPAKSPSSPRKSLNSNYRIGRKAENVAKNKERLSISITPTTSEDESEQQPVSNSICKEEKEVKDEEEYEEDEELTSEETTLMNLSKSLRTSLNTSNTFPRMQPSRKIQNINIVFPTEFTPKAPKRRPESADDEPEGGNESMTSSTPRTQYTLTRNIELSEDSECDTSSAEAPKKRSYTSFLLAEVEPRGVTTTMQMFAGLDSDESDGQEPPATGDGSASPHARFFASGNKSRELERIVQNSREVKRGDSLIREIIGELDRSIAESQAGARRERPADQEESSAAGENFVKKVVRVLEGVSFGSRADEDEDFERSYEEDSELAKSISISFKSDDAGSSSVDEEESTPVPTFLEYRSVEQEQQQQQQEPQEQQQQEKQQEEEEEEEVYWISAKNQDLARTSSRLSMLSRGSSRSGFQCTSGRCSPGLSPIKSERGRDEWTISLSSYRSQKTSRRLFRIDESGVIDSGCYSDRSGANSQSTGGTPAFSDQMSPSPLSSLSSSPIDFDGITTNMLLKMSRNYGPLSSLRV